MDITRNKMILAWVMAGSLCGLAQLNAADRDEPGVVRISSSRQSAGQFTPGSGILPTRFEDQSATPAAADPNCANAANGSTEVVEYDGNCYGRGGFCNTTPWWFGSRQIGVFRWLLCDGYCTVSPGHGWAQPYKVPVRRVPVGYLRYYADPVNARAAGAVQTRYPIIYTATDTTQLGYYYQRTPMWRDQPHLYPPAPVPANFHFRHCPNGNCCPTGGYNVMTESQNAAPIQDNIVPAVEPAATAAGDIGIQTN